MKHASRSAHRRNDDNPDDFQPHNRGPAALMAAASVGCAMAGVAICIATHAFHWAGLVANNFAVLLAIASVVLWRSRLGYGVVGLAIAAYFAAMLVPRWMAAG